VEKWSESRKTPRSRLKLVKKSTDGASQDALNTIPLPYIKAVTRKGELLFLLSSDGMCGNRRKLEQDSGGGVECNAKFTYSKGEDGLKKNAIRGKKTMWRERRLD